MKRGLILLTFFSSFFCRALGQSQSAAIDSLVKYRIITPNEKPVLEKEIKDKEHTSYKVKILGGLEYLMLKKTFHLDPHRTGVMLSYGPGHLNKKSQDSINISLCILLEKIKKAGLLTDRVYTYTQKGIDTGRYVAELQLIISMAEMSSRLERLAPNKLLPVAEQLHKNEIINDSSFLQLENDTKNNKIESSFQLNDYCQLDRVFDLAKYPDDPDIWLEQIHRDIASMLPGLTFTNFSYTTIPDTSFSIPGIRFKVSLVCSGRTYTHTSLTFNNYRSTRKKISAKDIYVEDFYRIFNKILIDQHSTYQLHSTMFSAESATENYLRHFALIALKERQAEAFMNQPTFHYMTVSLDRYNKTLTSAKIDSTIAEWRNIGLFAHLSNTEISKAIDDTEASDRFSTGQLLVNFPRVIYSLDSALISNYTYANLLNHLAKISRGVFNPTKITQKKANGNVKLQYFSNGKFHSFMFKTANVWLDVNFPVFMKRLGKENNLPGNFYMLLHEDMVIYLTKKQYDIAIKNKLLNISPTVSKG
ncbi:hypothetical protein [Mucilaginibacter sp.]|uniref:hypothetical protein n=1 Tax=Mucilaginibacter sp. TaxID=1882438 RepID=UPI003D14C598